MERFGRPRFRGAPAPKPFGTRPPSTRSGLLGAGPSHSSNQYGSFRDNQSQEWQPPRSSSGGSLLGAVPKRSSQNQNNSFGGSNASGGQQWKQENLSVPSEVRQLMQSLGLSQSDMQKLSQLPENELSVNNLARAIGDLRQGKLDFGDRQQSNSSGPPTHDRPDSYRRGQRGSYSGDGDSFNQRDGILGQHPGERRENYPSSRDEHFGNDRSPGPNRSYGSPSSRHKPTGIKVTVKPTDHPSRPEYMNSKGNSGFSGPRGPIRDDRNDEYYEESRFYDRDGSADRYGQRNDSYSQNSRRISNKNLSMREGPSRPGYGNDRRERDRPSPQGHGPRGRGGMSRPVGTRNVPKTSSIRPLMDESPRSGRGSGGLLGNPLRPNAQGLENLVAAVGGSTVSQAASLLNPLMLATQTDPSVLEAQIQAMKAIQAQAIKLKQQSHYEPSGRDRDRPRRRSPLPRGGPIDRRLEEEARKEAQEMRSARGRVLYIRYKSPRILETDLRQLAAPFGKVTKLLIIKPKIRNGHFQAFMEMDQWDCAAAMLEHYMPRSPHIQGCPVEVQRSNYCDLQIRSEQMQQRGSKRLRSISPIRKGTTQLPHKRDRRSDDKPKLSITTSKSDRRVVARSSDDSRPSDRKSSSMEKDKTRDLDNLDKTDAREILNRSRSIQDKNDSERRGRRTSARSRRRSLEPDNSEKTEDKPKEELNEDDQILEDQAKKDESAKKEDMEDPLDAIADELALHDEFVLMDEVGYDGEQKKAIKDGAAVKKPEDSLKEDEKKPQLDLERTDLDLEDVKVEISQDDQDAANDKKVEDGNRTDVAVPPQTKEDVSNTEEEQAPKVDVNDDDDVKKVDDDNNMDVNEEDVEKIDMDDDKDVLQEPNEELKDNDEIPVADEFGPISEQDAACLDNSTEQFDDAIPEDLPMECLADDTDEPKLDASVDNDDLINEDLDVSTDEVTNAVLLPVTENNEHPEDEGDFEVNMDKTPANDLHSVIKDSLKEISTAKQHLESLTKVTKAKAAQAIAKKLNVCLEVAITRLGSVDCT